MIRVKINKLQETSGGDDISNFYGGSDIDMRLPDESPENQLPQAWALHMPNGEPMSHDQTSHLAAPTNKGVEEEYELDEDLLFESELNEDLIYEKKDRCYYQAKQKFDVFPSAYASGYIVRCRKGKIGRKKKINESSRFSKNLEDMVSRDQRLRNEFAKDIKANGGWSQELLKTFMKKHGTEEGDVFGSKIVEDELLILEPKLDYENFSDEDWNNFWLLTQHMDRHLSFQEKILKIIEKYKGKESDNYRYLHDRISCTKYNKQLYGTQQGCEKVEKLDEKWSDKYKRSIDCNNPKGFSQRAHCQGRKKNEELELDLDELLAEGTFDKEKSQGLHGWFARKGGKGKSKGWVDCNTCRTNPKTGRKTCKTCGRQSGEQRSKYPACRPTPSACTKAGTSRKRGPMRVSWKNKKQEE